MEVKKIYVETRFKTNESKSDSDFDIELPRTFNVPENCICYLDDFVIPVSWSTIDERNNKLYIRFDWLGSTADIIVSIPRQNYAGATFAAALELSINTAVHAIFVNTTFKVIFDQNDNLITITQITESWRHSFLVSSADLLDGRNWSAPVPKNLIQSMNGIIRLGKTSYAITDETPYIAYLDLFTTRNLYLTSSALASYSNISNFDNDVIVKKIPISASFGQMMFYNASTGYDYLEVSKRSLTRIDFRLQDSYGNTINLRGNHVSFSLVFQIK
jgi:hypothetical protein